MSRRTDKVEAKVRAARLPRDEYWRIVGDYGTGQPCDGCDEVTTPQEFAVLVAFRDRQSVHFHRECFVAWLEAIRPRP